jgi:transposase InsO family protein
MSQLRKQLKGLLPDIAHEAKSFKDRTASQRYRDLHYVVYSKQTVELACKMRCISRDYFEKWAWRVLEVNSLMGLKSCSRRPKRQPGKTSEFIERRVRKLRKAEPFLGCERIKENLKLCVSRSTVNRILKRNGCISKKHSIKLTKKHTKRYRRPLPGYLQMDFKYVPFVINNQQYYQLSCVDHHSSWRMIRMYANKDLVAVEDFLIELKNKCPFPIIEIQTDNDASFTDKFWTDRPGTISGMHMVDEWCTGNGIRHKLIPVGVKEINGKVENTHKQDDREFFSQINPSCLGELQALSQRYEWRWNHERKTKALQWRTPNEVINNAYIVVCAYFKMLQQKHGLEIEQRKAKKQNSIDRYLKWMDEDAKKYGT